MIGSPASSWSMSRIETEAVYDRSCCPARLLRDGRPSSIHQAGRPKQQHRACAVMVPDLSLEGNMIANWCSRSTHPRASRTVPLHTLRNARQEAQRVYLTSLWPGVHFCRCTPSGRWQLRTCPGPPFLPVDCCCKICYIKSFARHFLLCREQHNVKQGYQLMLKTECNLFGVVETMTVLRNRVAGKQRDAVLLAFRYDITPSHHTLLHSQHTR